MAAVEQRIARFDAPAGDDRWRPTAVAAAAPSHGEIGRLVAENAAKYGIEPALIESVIAAESGFDANAISSAGARGLMQLMPQTAAALGVSDPSDPAQNVRGGTAYLHSLLERFGRIDLALAAYNAGPAAVERYAGIPPYSQTQAYVRAVLDGYHRRSQVGNLTSTGRSSLDASILP